MCYNQIERKNRHMKDRLIFKLVICFLLIFSIFIFKEKDSEANSLANGVYFIKSAIDDNYVLDITALSKENNANVELWKNNGGSNQKFEIKSVGNGYYTISNINSGKFLDVEYGNKNVGANIIQYTYNGADNQKWLIKSAGNGFYNIISKCNNLYLDIANGQVKNGANILTWLNHNGNNQKFRIELCEQVNEPKNTSIDEGYYTISPVKNSGYKLDLAEGSSKNGANIGLWSSNEANNQKFKIKLVENNTYMIQCVQSGKYLDVEYGLKNLGANVSQYTYNGADNQKWIFKDAGNGCYSIVSKCNNLYLDVANGVMKNGTNILMWAFNGGDNQKFTLIPTTPNIEDGGRSDEFKKAHPELKVGIDVSRYQGVIDWEKVKKDGIDYAMIRAGFRGYGESGSLNEDTMFERNVKGARDAGLDVGVYFFSQAKNYDEGVKEAEYTINLIKKFDITYPVAFDTEQSSSPTNTGRADNISVQDRTDATKGFCSTIEKSGYKTLIYASPYWIKDNLDITQLSEYKIWLANYTGATQENPLAKPSSYKGQYVMWQYTDSGTVNGIDGGVDCDIFYYEEMK